VAARLRGRGPLRIAALAAACAAFAGNTTTPVVRAASSGSLRGTVTVAGKPLASARLTLFGASRQGAAPIGHATTDSAGQFALQYERGSADVLYADATSPGSPRLRLRAVVGAGSAGGVQPNTTSTVTLNELTTVAAAYALAQFSGPEGIAGPSPGLEVAAATASNLASSATGKPGTVVTNAENGSKNDTLATLGTLANLVSLCASKTARCASVIHLATPPDGDAPADTAAALVDLARNPTLSPVALYALSRGKTTFQPALGAPPTAWILVLLYTANDLYASGRIAIDAKSNIWSSTNWQPGTQNGSTSISVLDPVGGPTFGTPISGGGMKGGAWGAAVAPGTGAVWMGSFGGASMVKYSATGTILSPGDGYTNGGLNHPQGIAVDQKANVWIANNYGPESAPGQGNVVVYPGGDPSKAIVITGGGLNHPFAVQIDGYGRAWVTNAGLGGAKLVGTRLAPLVGKFGGSVTVIGTDFKPTSFSPIESESFKWPLATAVDSQNNVWVVNYFSNTATELQPDGTVAGVYELPHGTIPWGNAVDGSDRVWIAGFVRPAVVLLCGANTSACPPGSTTGALLSPRLGFRSKAFQHFTSIQIDQSGNVWLSNNWSQLVPPVGGTGIAELIGAATPVCTPLQPLPAKPSSTSATPCEQQTSEALPASLGAASSSGTSVWMWVAVGLAAALFALAAGVVVLRRRRVERSDELPTRPGSESP
jgi:hypothetical protein